MSELSVIIPSYNRAGLLRVCLEALCRQTRAPGDFEVIVVVDGSTDGTEAMLSAFRPSYELRVMSQTNRGQAVALNRGLETASARYCLFLDDDIVAESQLVAEHLRTQFAHGGVVGLGNLPRVLPDHPDGFARYLAEW